MLRLLAVAFAFASSVYAVDREDRIRRSVPVSSAVHLTLNVEFGSIKVQPGTGRRVDVEVYFRGVPPSGDEFDRMLGDFTLDVAEQASDVRVVSMFKDGWTPMLFFWVFDHPITGHPICRYWQCLEYSSWLREAEYRITVPQEFSVDVETSGGPISVEDLRGEVNARTSGGSLTFSRIDGPVHGRTSGGRITLTGGTGRAIVHTSGGPIRIAEAAGEVDASTSGGSISIERTSGRVNAHTSGGPITVNEPTGPIDASTSGGIVTLSLLGQPKEECRLYTSGGSITVTLGKDVHINLDASTSGGKISTDFPVRGNSDRPQRKLRAPLNGGGPLLYLHTSGGAIGVRRAS